MQSGVKSHRWKRFRSGQYQKVSVLLLPVFLWSLVFLPYSFFFSARVGSQFYSDKNAGHLLAAVVNETIRLRQADQEHQPLQLQRRNHNNGTENSSKTLPFHDALFKVNHSSIHAPWNNEISPASSNITPNEFPRETPYNTTLIVKPVMPNITQVDTFGSLPHYMENMDRQCHISSIKRYLIMICFHSRCITGRKR